MQNDFIKQKEDCTGFSLDNVVDWKL